MFRSYYGKSPTKIKSFAGLQIFATTSSILTNGISGDVYLSIALPGRMLAPAYRGMGYSTKNLSRLSEGGTLISPLIPWNVGGAFVMSVLGLGYQKVTTKTKYSIIFCLLVHH